MLKARPPRQKQSDLRARSSSSKATKAVVKDVAKTIVDTAKKSQPKAKAKGISRLFPSKKFITMVYSNAHGVTSSTTQTNFGTSVLYYLNCIYGPKVSLPDYNPQGYDQIYAIYGKYKVFGCKVDIVFSNPSQNGLFVGVRASQHGESDYLDAEKINLAEMKKWTIIKPINKSGSQTLKLSRYYNIGAIECLTKSQFNNNMELYSSAINQQPTNKPYIGVSVANSQDTTAATIAYTITMTYYVQLFDRSFFTSSVYA